MPEPSLAFLRDTMGNDATRVELLHYITALKKRHRSLLREIEWARRNGVCPYCHASHNLHGEHKEGCKIGAELAKDSNA